MLVFDNAGWCIQRAALAARRLPHAPDSRHHTRGNRRRAIIAVALWALCCLARPAPAPAQFLPAAIAALTLRTFLGTAKDAANDVVDHAGTVADGRIVQAANQLSVLLADANATMNRDLDLHVSDLKGEKAELLARIYDLQTKLGTQARSGVMLLQDTSAVNVRSLFSTLPFVRDELYVQAIYGTAQIAQEAGDYKMIVVGSASARTPTRAKRPLPFGSPACRWASKTINRLQAALRSPSTTVRCGDFSTHGDGSRCRSCSPSRAPLRCEPGGAGPSPT